MLGMARYCNDVTSELKGLAQKKDIKILFTGFKTEGGRG